MSIQWPNYLLFILLLMPGALIPIMKRIGFFRYLPTGELYLIGICSIQCAYILVYKNYWTICICLGILIGVVIPIVAEMAVNRSKDYLSILSLILKHKPIFLFPILEEINFRWLLFQVGYMLQASTIGLVVISSLAFGISHYPYLGNKGLIKIVQGATLSILFIRYGLLMSILCHMVFNMLVLVRANNKSNNAF